MSVKNIYIVGFMGTGKSTVAKLLAQRTRRRLVDTDKLIEKRAGKTIGEIFAQRGEAGFREIECEVIGELSPVEGIDGIFCESREVLLNVIPRLPHVMWSLG